MKHILLIDDDLFIRDLVATKLTNDQYSVATAGTGAEGLEKMAKNKPDLILLDLELPDTHGLEILKIIKTGPETASVPVVIFSNNNDPELQQKVAAAGAVAFLVKVTMDMSELQAELNKYIK